VQSYFNGQAGGCPIKNAIDADGACASHLLTPNNGACSTYCEIRVFLSYGQEVPYPKSDCTTTTQPCLITTETSVTIEQSFSFNIDGGANLGKRDRSRSALGPRGVNLLEALSAAFDVVSSNNDRTHFHAHRPCYREHLLNILQPRRLLWPYKIVTVVSVGTGQREHLTEFAMQENADLIDRVPVFVTSCGTLTTAPVLTTTAVTRRNPLVVPQIEEVCDTSKRLTTANWCNTTVSIPRLIFKESC
jgi:hypothetical protein